MKTTAWIFQINISQGGVPKLAIPGVEISTLGLQGDAQKHTHVHGGEDRAVCIYSLDIIMELQREGHTVFPGALGENLTIAGLDWQTLKPEVKLSIGKQLIVELTSYTTPCSALTEYFMDGDISRISQIDRPGWARFYARVLQPGVIQIGDAVRILET